MRRTLPDLDKQIIEESQKLFLEKGLLAVEMKDIAAQIGISRSTLYRHFTNKLDIAFDIVKKYITNLYDIEIKLSADISGYEYVSTYLSILLDKLFNTLRWVQLLREVDILYTSQTPVTAKMEEYESFFRDYASPLEKLVQRGISDGSIRNDIPARKLTYILSNTCISLTQRIGLREAIYEREHGFGFDVITDSVQILLDGIKSKKI